MKCAQKSKWLIKIRSKLHKIKNNISLKTSNKPK